MVNNIRKLRKEHGLTLQELSSLVGLGVSTLSGYEKEKGEKGFRNPKIENWQKLADYFGVSVEHLQGKTFINKRPDKKKMTTNDLVKVNFQFINPDVNTTTYIKKSDCLGLTFIKDRFIKDYEEDGELKGIVNLDQIVHVTFLDKVLKGKR